MVSWERLFQLFDASMGRGHSIGMDERWWADSRFMRDSGCRLGRTRDHLLDGVLMRDGGTVKSAGIRVHSMGVGRVD